MTCSQSFYPDVPEDYRAKPFIQQLTQANILTGYPDGTFRPQQPIDRDEYAAVIRQAFEVDQERELATASAFADVPKGYWAEAAIEEAYEGGFLGTPKANQFNPQSNITRADAIVALVKGLEPIPSTPKTVASIARPAAAQTVQPVRKRRKSANRLIFPLASTAMMQLFAPPANASTHPAASPATQASGTNPNVSAEPNLDLSRYYADADQIPDYAKDKIALATEAGLVMNYPNLNQLNPTQPLSRGGAAALIYQALIYSNGIKPLPENVDVSAYRVRPSDRPQ